MEIELEMWLKENKDNLRTIICKILVSKHNKPDWNESWYSRSRHNAKQTSFTSPTGARRQCGEHKHAQYCTNHDVTSGWSCRRPENVSILSSLLKALDMGILFLAVFTLELEMDYPSETSLCTVTPSPQTPPLQFFLRGGGGCTQAIWNG